MYVTQTMINPLPYQRSEKNQGNPSNYRVYMLRVWRENSSSSGSLRLTVEDTRTGNRVGFTDWDEFAMYLHGEIDEDTPPMEAGEPH